MTKQLERRRAGEAETGVIVLGVYFCGNLLFIEYLPVLFSGSGSVCSRKERLGPKLSSRVDRQSRTCKKKIAQVMFVPSGVPRRGCSAHP